MVQANYNYRLVLDPKFVANARNNRNEGRDRTCEMAETHMMDMLRYGFTRAPLTQKPNFDANCQFETTEFDSITISALTLIFAQATHQQGNTYMDRPSDAGISEDFIQAVKDPNQYHSKFAPPIYLSVMNNGWSIFTLLKHTEIDPNPDCKNIKYYTISRYVNSRSDKLALGGDRLPTITPLEILTERYIQIANRPQTDMYEPDAQPHYFKKAILAMIDAGAVVTDRVYSDLKIDPELLGAMDTLKQSGLTMIHDDDAVITLTDIKRMHAFGTLKHTFVEAQHDDALSAKLLALRGEIPKWMEKQYGPGFDLLSTQDTWKDAVSGERGSWREGR